MLMPQPTRHYVTLQIRDRGRQRRPLPHLVDLPSPGIKGQILHQLPRPTGVDSNMLDREILAHLQYILHKPAPIQYLLPHDRQRASLNRSIVNLLNGLGNSPHRILRAITLRLHRYGPVHVIPHDDDSRQIMRVRHVNANIHRRIGVRIALGIGIPHLRLHPLHRVRRETVEGLEKHPRPPRLADLRLLNVRLDVLHSHRLVDVGIRMNP